MSGARLSLEEREEIALGIASGRSLTGIARGVSRPVSTVAREVARNGGRRRYRAVVAERATRRRACRPKARRLAVDRELAREVERRLRLRPGSRPRSTQPRVPQRPRRGAGRAGAWSSRIGPYGRSTPSTALVKNFTERVVSRPKCLAPCCCSGMARRRSGMLAVSDHTFAQQGNH